MRVWKNYYFPFVPHLAHHAFVDRLFTVFRFTIEKKSPCDLVLQVTLQLLSKYCFLSLKGEDVLERSSELIHSGDVIKTSNGSSQSCSMFLFDHQLVYCKKVIVSSEYWNRTYLSPFTTQAAVTGTLTRMQIDLPLMRSFFSV